MEMINEISIDGFKVVSGDYFTSVPKPSVPTMTIGDGKIGFTKRDVLALNSCEHVLIRVNAEERKILVVPSKSTDKDAIKWVVRTNPVEARKVSCTKLTDMLCELWGWDKNLIYRGNGRLVSSNNKVMLLFDFSQPDKWKRPEAKNAE